MDGVVENADAPRDPFLQRLAARPLAFAASVLAALVLGYAAVTGAAALVDPAVPPAPSPWRDPRWFSFEIHQLALLAISLAGIGYGVRGALHAVGALEAAGRVPAEETRALAAEAVRLDRRPVALVAGGALLFSVAISFYTPVWSSGVAPPLFNPWRLWFIARLAATIAAALVWALLLLRLGTRLASAATRAPVDLLDARAFELLLRASAISLALWVAYLSLLAFILVLPAPLELSVVFLGLALALSALVFLRPLLVMRRALLRTRERELSAARAAVREVRARGDAPPGRLADLLTWEARVAAARTWPIDAGGLARLGLYAAVGLASWVGAALVERVLGALLR
jgi:hypothetical protein